MTNRFKIQLGKCKAQHFNNIGNTKMEIMERN